MTLDDYPFGELTVHRIGFGTAALTDSIDGGRFDHAASVAVVRQAVEWGVDHIDIAPRHAPGVVHAVLREALDPYPEGLALVATVGGGPQSLRDAVLAHLDALGVERLAAVNLRLPGPGPDGGGAGFDEQLDVVAGLRDEGLIAEIGLSHVSLDQLEIAADRVEITTVRNPFSVVDRSSEPLLWACARQGIGFVPCHPLGAPVDDANPVLSHPAVRAIADRWQVTAAQAVLAWYLDFAPNLLPTPSTLSLARLREYLDAASLRLERPDLAELDAG